MPSLFDEAGGEPAIRAVIDAFVTRMAGDPIIGFFFAGKDLDRIRRHEYEHAARSLGAELPYTGRPIPELHRPLKINAGQFRRRLALLRQELENARLPAAVIETWIGAQRAMQDRITDGTDCEPTQ